MSQVVFDYKSYTTLHKSCYPNINLNETLYVCHKCFKYTVSSENWRLHLSLCDFDARTYGSTVYEDDNFIVTQLDALKSKLFAQNLSLFTALFLNQKCVYYDLQNFLFYLLYDKQENLLGFFSKEKYSWFNYNLACIFVFPQYQGRGFGSFLIAFSYIISQKLGSIGSPEEPLSESGYRSYLTYWCDTVSNLILEAPVDQEISMKYISNNTGMIPEHILCALSHMNCIGLSSGAFEVSLNELKRYANSRKNKKRLIPHEDCCKF